MVRCLGGAIRDVVLLGCVEEGEYPDWDRWTHGHASRVPVAVADGLGAGEYLPEAR